MSAVPARHSVPIRVRFYHAYAKNRIHQKSASRKRRIRANFELSFRLRELAGQSDRTTLVSKKKAKNITGTGLTKGKYLVSIFAACGNEF